ncbi:MAG: DJ-1/PfpI family protein [Chitinophagales bacterium]
MAHTPKNTIKSRKIAILAAGGADTNAITQMKKALKDAGAMAEIISPKYGQISAGKGNGLSVDKSLMTVASVLYDAVYLPGGKESVQALAKEADAIHFINQAYKHCKAIAFDPEALDLINKTNIGGLMKDNQNLPGLISNKSKEQIPKLFIKAIAQHRFWERENMPKVPA